MVPWHPPIRAEQLAELHGDDAACPGPWRVRRKLPHLLAPPSGQVGLDRVVVATLLAHGELLNDLARLCADALRRSGAGELDNGSESAVVKGLSTRVAASLAVALMQSDLPERVTALLAEEAPFAEGWRACPE
ncbi:MAG: hypothetical protein VKI83_03650 [Synechococcaceae cyanobacterium]|nr:hypothetical protein [Synechococcaceae cyanobacterium]